MGPIPARSGVPASLRLSCLIARRPRRCWPRKPTSAPQDRGHAVVAGLVGHASDDDDGGTSTALAEHDAGGGDQVGEGFLLPLDLAVGFGVFGDAQRGDPGGTNGDHRGAEPVGAAVGVGDDYREIGTGGGG
jgi:hypothetical protein